MPRFARNRFHFHQPLRDFGHLLFKQFFHKPGRGAGYQHLRISAAVFHAAHKHLDHVFRRIRFRRRLILRQHHAFDLAIGEIHVHVLIVDLAHGGFQQFALFIRHRGERIVAFLFAKFLQNHLLCRLCGDSAEILRHKRMHDLVAFAVFGIDRLRFFYGNLLVAIRHFRHHFLHGVTLEDALFGIDIHKHFRAAVVLFFICGIQRVFQRFDKFLFTDSLFLAKIVESGKKFFVIHFTFTPDYDLRIPFSPPSPPRGGNFSDFFDFYLFLFDVFANR